MKKKILHIGDKELQLLSDIHDKGVRLGVISSGLVRKQTEKILRLGIDRFIDHKLIFITHGVGMAKSNVQLYQGVTEFQVLTDYIITQGGILHPKKLGRILNVGDMQSRGILFANGWVNSEEGFYLPNPSLTGKLFFNINLRNRFS